MVELCDICDVKIINPDGDTQGNFILVDLEFILCKKHTKEWVAERKNIQKQFKRFYKEFGSRIDQWRLIEFIVNKRIEAKKKYAFMIR